MQLFILDFAHHFTASKVLLVPGIGCFCAFLTFCDGNLSFFVVSCSHNLELMLLSCISPQHKLQSQQIALLFAAYVHLLVPFCLKTDLLSLFTTFQLHLLKGKAPKINRAPVKSRKKIQNSNDVLTLHVSVELILALELV